MKRDDLEALGADLYPDIATMHEERRELLRQAAVRALALGTVPKVALQWYRQVAAWPALPRPLSSGVPA